MTKAIRQIRVEGNVAFVPLTKGHEAIIDVTDVPLVAGFNWFAHVAPRTVYAGRQEYAEGRQSIVLMHRVLLAAEGLHIDHRDGNGLNNRRVNIRAVTQAQNNLNRRVSKTSASGLKGVQLHKPTGRYQARLVIGGRNTSLGYFATKEAAFDARLKAAAQAHGGFFNPGYPSVFD